MVHSDPFHSFKNIPTDIEASIRKSFKVSVYSPGETIFIQGSNPRATYLVASGKVKIVRVTKEGHESILCVRGAGDYFCPVPILDAGDHLGTAVSMTETTVLWIDRDDFNTLCRESPALLNIVQRDCLAEVRHLLNRLESFAFRNVRERIAIALLREERRQNDSVPCPNEIGMTQQELASLVGASREGVSRSLKKMEGEGILMLSRGKVTICDQERLKQITS